MYEENEIYSKHTFTANGVVASSQSKSVATEMNGMKNVNEKQAIEITNATAKWSELSAENSLNNVSFSVNKGTLLAVIGPVGAGKVSIRSSYYIRR